MKEIQNLLGKRNTFILEQLLQECLVSIKLSQKLLLCFWTLLLHLLFILLIPCFVLLFLVVFFALQLENSKRSWGKSVGNTGMSRILFILHIRQLVF